LSIVKALRFADTEDVLERLANELDHHASYMRLAKRRMGETLTLLVDNLMTVESTRMRNELGGGDAVAM
jgi:hypothetical protein